MKKNTQKRRCFAAANGYNGFRSYFNIIFNPREYLRLYVLKGGPGTGKSSLMKKVSSYFCERGLDCEEIYCSSDINSLDGIIIRNENVKIGILDATAPHETDAKFPGAIDEIVNLGIGWNRDGLIEERKKILDINEEKAAHYKKAYEYLTLAGEFYKRLASIIEDCYTGNDKDITKDLLLNIRDKKRGSNEQIRLISAFGKNGYSRFDIKSYTENSGISLTGKYGSEYVFTNHFLNELKRNDIEYVRFPSPYSDCVTEALKICTNDRIVSIGNDFDEIIDTSIFLDERKLCLNKKRLDYYTEEKNRLIAYAQEEFTLASNSHFMLEKIYSPSMNFKIIDSITDELINNIEFYLK